ncbi:hypothetical protein CPB83DRAFT_605416 [Crepidotus variabilis]|uniref:Uncharacterized protein n=1 Tax=Crepidotus variabilis TaxID=179855 RepID=A0A9P6E8B4_9AGAR|nr:hypothetical protein CPB83DRAFT_605416 [Crepidotus variabilis]
MLGTGDLFQILWCRNLSLVGCHEYSVFSNHLHRRLSKRYLTHINLLSSCVFNHLLRKFGWCPKISRLGLYSFLLVLHNQLIIPQIIGVIKLSALNAFSLFITTFTCSIPTVVVVLEVFQQLPIPRREAFFKTSKTLREILRLFLQISQRPPRLQEHQNRCKMEFTSIVGVPASKPWSRKPWNRLVAYPAYYSARLGLGRSLQIANSCTRRTPDLPLAPCDGIICVLLFYGTTFTGLVVRVQNEVE